MCALCRLVLSCSVALAIHLSARLKGNGFELASKDTFKRYQHICSYGWVATHQFVFQKGNISISFPRILLTFSLPQLLNGSSRFQFTFFTSLEYLLMKISKNAHVKEGRHKRKINKKMTKAKR